MNQMISCFRRDGHKPTESSRVVFLENTYRSSDRRQGGRLHSATKVFGRDGDRDRVKAFLIGTDSEEEEEEEKPAIVPIVGIGGLGKTTLARYVYNDKEVDRHFELRVWFLVSEDLNLPNLMREVIKSAAGNGEDDGSNSEVELQFAVAGRRLLLVLDDVWDESVEDLNRFRALLRGAAGGSRILVTTRSEGVVTGLGAAASVHRLEGLSDEHCWRLFKQRAFGAVREETEELEAMGCEIVSKCHGVPLIAIAIGGMLHFETDRSVWKNVRDSEVWELPKMASHTLSALKLSYDHLPSHLKKCFEYCSLLPKAHEIDREKLAELWAAEGFVPVPGGEGTRLEDAGGGCFDDLLRRSFFEEDVDSDYDHGTSYRMHDLFLDLARSIVGDEHWTVKYSGRKGRVPKGCRRLALVCGFIPLAISGATSRSERLETLLSLMENPRSKRLETLLFLMENPITIQSAPRCTIDRIPHEIFSSLRNLQLLDLSSTAITELPTSIGRLAHLKHLNASETQIGALPESTGKLRSLHTLNLKLCTRLQTLPSSIKNLLKLAVLNLEGCKSLQELPEGLCNMRCLVHLGTSGCLSLTRMPSALGRLTNLQTLSMFAVDEEKGCSIAELQHLDQLRDVMYIKNLGNLDNPVAAGRANLREKPWLRRLELHWNRKGYGDDSADVLEGLQPHPNLEELEMKFYGGTELPGWMAAASLPNLVQITLGGFGRCRRLPLLGELPSLKRLELMSLDVVEQLGEEFYGNTGTFPALEELVAIMMPMWEEWPSPSDGILVFPRLTAMNLTLCSKLRTLPHLPSLRSLILTWNSPTLLSEQSLGGAGLPCLRELHICRCAGASSTWDSLRHLTALEELIVESFEGPALPVGVEHLPSLRSLSVKHCPNLAALPERLENSTTLQSLEIDGCPELTSLSERMQRLVITGDQDCLDWRK